jgi:putative ABC transport system permease protein
VAFRRARLVTALAAGSGTVLILLVPVLSAALGAAAGSTEDGPAGGDRAGDVLVTRQLAEAHGLAVGDLVRLAGEPRGNGRPFRIVGVYEPTPDPMRLTHERHEARVHLPDLLELEDADGSITAINVALEDPRDASSFSSDLTERIPGLGVWLVAASGAGAGPFAVLERFHVAISIVTVIGATAFLLALMVMRVDERRETVGILRLIGLTRRRILLAVLVEGSLIATAGALFGVLFALATQGLVNRFFQWYYDTALVFVRVTADIAVRCVVLAVPLGVLAGLVASWSLLRRDVVALLRR